jgi:hypothetical protein
MIPQVPAVMEVEELEQEVEVELVQVPAQAQVLDQVPAQVLDQVPAQVLDQVPAQAQVLDPEVVTLIPQLQK